MELTFRGPVWFWKGPAPWFYVTVPDAESAEIESVAAMVTYGWGVIPVTATVGGTTWATSLFPKDGSYLVPLKAVVRKAEGIDLDDEVAVHLHLAGA